VLDGLRAIVTPLRWAGVFAVVAILLSGLTVVRPDEVALRLRFGRLTGVTPAEQVHGPGLMVALPYLVDEVIRVPVKRIQELRVEGLAANPRGEQSDWLDITRTGYGLTGDHNIVQLTALVKYQIADPVAWALRLERPEAMIRESALGALTQTLAEMTVDAVLVEEKARLLAAALARAQARLDRDGHWVRLVALEIVALKPPRLVAGAFEQVQTTFVERKTKIEQARGFREHALPAAAGAAEGELRAAEAQGAELLARAGGEAAAFSQLLEEYRRDPAVVRERLYREAMQQVLSQVGSRVLLPPGPGRGRILLPGDATPGEWRGPGG
jgi:membrane protease subunit HflK